MDLTAIARCKQNIAKNKTKQNFYGNIQKQKELPKEIGHDSNCMMQTKHCQHTEEQIRDIIASTDYEIVIFFKNCLTRRKKLML